MTRPENGPVDLTALNRESETAETEEAGEKGSKENDEMPLNEEDKSRNSLEQPLPVITSTLPPPPTPLPIFSIIQSTTVIEIELQIEN